MSRVVAVAALKGGSGKSTIAVNLACQLATRPSVALVDADTQGTASYWIHAGDFPVSCHVWPLEENRGARKWIGRVLSLSADYVLIDTPPHLRTTTTAAVGVADLVLIPVTPSGADLVASIPALELVREARRARRTGPACLLVPSRVDRRTATGREIEDALRSLGQAIGPSIRQRSALVDCFSAHQWIGDFAPGSDAHKDFMALAQKVRGVLRDGKA